MSLTSKICLFVADLVRNSEEEIKPDEVVGALVAAAGTFGKKVIGEEKTLIHFTNSMILIADHDMVKIDMAIKNMKKVSAMVLADEKSALTYGVLAKIGGVNNGSGQSSN